MEFNLPTAHVGDLLLLAPALRCGDVIYGLPKQHQLPQLPVTYRDTKPGVGLFDLAGHRSNEHRTQAWLRMTNRTPYKHCLFPANKQDGFVLAPCVQQKSKRWPYFDLLLARIREKYRNSYITVIDDKTTRHQWMLDLASADTVICPDTGTAHMADALGVRRVVVLYPTKQHHQLYHTFWNQDHHLIADGDMSTITVDHVMEHL